MEIISITTSIRCLFSPDVIPWTHMLAPSNRTKLQARYKFNEVRQATDANGNPVQFLFMGGEFPLKGIPHAVEQLIVEPVAIQSQVVMNSDEANSFLDDISTLLGGFRPGRRFSWSLAYTQVYQTTAVARLAVKQTALISKELRRFIGETTAEAVALPDAKAEITLERLGWRVSYQTQSANFLYLPKAFTIEPRAGSKPSEQLYFTQSPTKYKKHLELLAEFENLLGQRKTRQKRSHKSKP